MITKLGNPTWEVLRIFFRPHPWHGISMGESAPETVTAYIEVVPTDTVKYELEKSTGFLKLDRPQKFSNVCPTPYGFIPQTYCGGKVASLAAERTGRTSLLGDGDPLESESYRPSRTAPNQNMLTQKKPQNPDSKPRFPVETGAHNHLASKGHHRRAQTATGCLKPR